MQLMRNNWKIITKNTTKNTILNGPRSLIDVQRFFRVRMAQNSNEMIRFPAIER